MPGSHPLRARLLLLPAVLLLSASLAACGDVRGGASGEEADPDVPEEDRYGGTVTVGAYGDLQSMNSLTSSDYSSGEIQREMLFMPLVKYDEDLNPVPWLAESWDTVRVAPDSLELTFHLRRDIRWHDGEPTDAEDVAFTFDRAIEPATAFPNASAFALYAREGTVVDPYTYKIRLKPHSDFLDIWYQTPVMPEHILGDVPPSELLTHPFGTQEPVGNGPFRFVRRIQGQEWVFEANPDFPEELGGRPYIDRFVYRYIPEQTTLLSSLLTGEIDVYMGPNPQQADQIASTPGVELKESPFRQWVYIAWNTRLPMFDDARERRALSMAIDRDEIVDALVYGYGEAGRATVTPAHWSFDPEDETTQIPYDPEGARELLAEAGWIDRDDDGILEDAQGNEFRFTLKTNQGNDTRKDITEVVQAQLRPLGIVVEPRLVEWNTMIEQLQGSLDERGERVRDFDAVVSSWVDYFRKDDSDILHSRNLDDPYQYVGYSNPRVDELIDTLGVMIDREKAMPLWKEYQRLMAEEAPYTTIYYPRRLVGVSRRIRGEVMDTRGEFINISDWWIAPDDRRAGTERRAAPSDTSGG